MPSGFPPNIVYPIDFDDQSTLYLVYNTSQSTLSANNSAGSSEISVVPVGEDEDEIWAGNGFITIEGELIYYDLVAKDSNGKVNKFKRCYRNFDRTTGGYNPQGTPVMGFVVAEHPNQIAQAIINTETFIGKNFDEDEETLDWRIRNLQDTTRIDDDYGCPEISLTIRTVSSSPATGTTIAYEIEIIGVVDSFILEFGNGDSTTSTDSGEYTYAPSANIDPIIRATNGNCMIIQTPIVRDSNTEPVIPVEDDGLVVNIPDVVLGDINISVDQFELDVPVINVNFPCSDFNFPDISIPSVIVVSPEIPSVISFTDISIPDTITINSDIPSQIEFLGSLPSSISFEGSLPSIIEISGFQFDPISFVDPNIPESISFENVPEFPSVIAFGPSPTFGPVPFASPPEFPAISFDDPPSMPRIEWEDPPVLSVDYGTPPEIIVSVVCAGASESMAARSTRASQFMDDSTFTNSEQFSQPKNNPEVAFLGIPDEIKIVSNLPETIELVCSPIELITPKFIELDCSGLRDINVNLIHDLPKFIPLVLEPIAPLKFEDIPPLRFESFPEIKFPEIVVKLDIQNLIGETKEKAQCVQIVNCT